MHYRHKYSVVQCSIWFSNTNMCDAVFQGWFRALLMLTVGRPANMYDAHVYAMAWCMADAYSWMTRHRLKLNTDQINFILLGTRQQLQLEKVKLRTIRLNGADVPVSITTTLLSVLIHIKLTFAEHIKRLTGRYSFQLRQLHTVRRALTIRYQPRGLL